jgi:predicted HNH restriction endonuclease
MGKQTGSLVRRICPCGKLSKNVGLDKNGNTRYGVLCYGCNTVNTKNKKDHCERCNFIPVHSVQLEIDHADGNRRNNKAENLVTLCCNCHRLKTHANNEWLNRYGVKGEVL